MLSVWRDVKYGLRTLVRSPGFTVVAVLSLALGIGANTAIFTLTNAVFLNPLPVRDAARVIQVYTVDHATTVTTANLFRTPLSWLNFKDFREQNQVFTGMAGYLFSPVTLTGHGEPKPETALLVTANYFDLLGVKPALGRTFFSDEDRREGGNPVTVLSYSFWQRLLGGDRSAIGQTVEFNSIPYTVIGVAPPEFKGTQTIAPADLAWIPISMHAQVLPQGIEKYFNERRMRLISAFGRLRPGAGEAQAAAALRAIAANLERAYPVANNGRTIDTSSLAEAALGFLPRAQVLRAGLALSAIVALVLLIACGNLANLLLARAARRAREMGIRTALGAPRSRLLRQLLTESLLLSAAGGAAGLALGSAGAELLWSFRPAGLQANAMALRTDWRVLLFAALVTMLTAALFGIAPAARTSLANLAEVLKSGARGTEAFARSRLRAALVVGEISLALVALAGAGLFIRSMQRVQRLNPGFETRRLFVFNFDLGPQHFSPGQGRAFFHTVLDRAAAVPGVRSAALATNPPMGGGLLGTLVAQDQESDPNQRGVLTMLDWVSPGYFDTLRIPILEGRGLTEFDRPGSARVAVISQAMARHFWPGQSALGKRFRFTIEKEYREVVGVSANAVIGQIGEQPQPIAYLPLEQDFRSAVTLHVRTSGDPAAVLPAMLRQVQSLAPNVALTNPSTIQQVISRGLWAPRMGAALFGVFGLLTLLLASVGVYGVMAYMVSQRTGEIGLRMALGAAPGSVLSLVVGQAMRLAGAGILLGIAGGLLVTRLMASLLFDVPTYDPLTFGGVGAVVALVALLAGFLPARRAASIDPARALRQE